MSRNAFRIAILVTYVLALGAFIAAPAASADTTLTVGKASANADPIIPVNIGYKIGIFQRHGLDLKIVDFAGGSKMGQAMAAGAIDIGDGAGTELAFAAKGAPMLGVCQSASTFPFLGIGLPANSPIKSVKDYGVLLLSAKLRVMACNSASIFGRSNSFTVPGEKFSIVSQCTNSASS
jgi:NitT/TauT family transport system substrate-binding protein